MCTAQDRWCSQREFGRKFKECGILEGVASNLIGAFSRRPGTDSGNQCAGSPRPIMKFSINLNYCVFGHLWELSLKRCHRSTTTTCIEFFFMGWNIARQRCDGASQSERPQAGTAAGLLPLLIVKLCPYTYNESINGNNRNNINNILRNNAHNKLTDCTC